MSLVEMIVSGIVATLFMDIWQRLLLPRVGIPPGNWALVGRWFVSAGQGRLFPGPAAALPAVENELAIGWIGHYAVGVVYGIIYVAVVRFWLGLEPGPLNGLVFGFLSVVVPWLFFMPAMGNGMLGSRTPNPPKACLLAFLAHGVFGLGLGVGALLA